MTKLTDTQLILLTSAAHRQDGSLLPPPNGSRASSKRIRTSVAALLKRGFAEEVEVAAEAQCWREDEDRRVGLRIMDAGRCAIGLAPATEEATLDPAEKKSMPTNDVAMIARAGTKRALVVDLLKRDTGASITELADATGWLPHTTRAALTGLRKRGCTILSEKEAGASRYRLLDEAQA